MASILFSDADGTWRLHNGKPWPASRFAGWTPDSVPFGESAARQSDGAITMLRLRTDYGVSFDLPLIHALRSTNLLLRSEEFDNAAWTKGATTVSANSGTAPNGSTLTADKLNEDNTTAVHTVGQAIAGLTDNTTYLFSSFLAAAERSWVFLNVIGKDSTTRAIPFQLTTGMTGTPIGGALVAFGSEFARQGWYRCWVAATVASGGATPSFVHYLSPDGVATNYTGTAGSGVFAYGAQVEPYVAARPYPSPYLMTTSAARTGVSMSEIADRLRFHLMNGGTCTVYTNDLDASSYATCGLKPGTVPQLALTDRRTMEFTLSLHLINLAGSPTRMIAVYAEE